MKLFDANTWVGAWPFSFAPVRDPGAHAAALRRAGIARALVSPLEAVFAPEPGPANRRLLEGSAGLRSLVPLPVVNPALANWAEELDRVAADPRVRAVRWLPAYHNYRLNERRVSACAEALRERGLRLVLSVRLIDERHEYFALRIRGLKNAVLEPFLRRNPELPVLLTGLYRPDLESLLKACPRVWADVSFAEWDRTVDRLAGAVDVARLVLGTNTPLLIPAAGAAKVLHTDLKRPQQAAVAHANLETFLSCRRP